MIDDLQGYTFAWINVYPPDNYLDDPPVRNYSEVVTNSRLGLPSYATTDQTKEKLVLPLQSYYSLFGTLGLDPDSQAPFKPEIPLPGTFSEDTFFGTLETLVPEGTSLDDAFAQIYLMDRLIFGNAISAGHTKLWYSFVTMAYPTISSATSGFMDWDQGFGSSVYYELQYFDHNGEWDKTLDEMAITGADLQAYYSNMDNVKQYWLQQESYYFAPIVSYCEVAHQHVPFYGSDIIAGELESPAAAAALNNDALNVQVLTRTHASPLAGYSQYWRTTPAGTWSRPLNYSAYAAEGLTYEKDYPRSTGMTAAFSEAITGNETAALYDASVTSFDPTGPSRNQIINDMLERFPNKAQVKSKSQAYISKRLEHYNKLLGEVITVPREYQARRQASPSLSQTMISSLEDSGQYVTDVAASIPGETTTGMSSGGMISTTYSGGSGASGGGY